jgi:predicted DNA-binding transcriptional regulator YafY
MLHFAHFEKQAQRLGDDQYLLHLKYDKDDETEMVIRVLSFGPCVKVLEPQHFAELIRERLITQKNCGLR